MNKKLMFGTFSLMLSAMFCGLNISAQTSTTLSQARETAITNANARQAAHTDSINAIAQKAQQGDADAQNEVGVWYYMGINNYPQNDSIAVRWWAKSANQGNVKAVGNLGLCYQTGRGVEQDSLRAVGLYTTSIKRGNRALFDKHLEWAEKGYTFSNVFLGVCYQKGIGTSRDMQQSISHFTVAANNESSDACRELGLIYMAMKKPEQAVGFFQKAALKEDLSSTYYYGQLLFDGNGIEKDESTGLIYLLKAAEAGMPQAQFVMGNIYGEGKSVAQSAEQAFKWYVMAGEQGHQKAELAVAQYYLNGIGVQKSYIQALQWYSLAYSNNAKSVIRKMALGEIDGWKNTPFMSYLEGMKLYAVAKDYNAALQIFKNLEKAGIVEGKTMQGVVLSDDNFEKKDLKKALKLLEEASATDPMAAYQLGLLYEFGKGVEKDMAKALELYVASAEKGYSPAQCYLGDIYYEGRGVDTDYTAAVNYYLQAKKQNALNPNSVKRLASCYENGWGDLEENKKYAAELLKKNRYAEITEVLSLIPEQAK